MKYLVTGSNGQIGSTLMEKTRSSIGIDLRDADIVQDISKKKVVENITKEKPDVVVHTAAMTDLDDAEENPERAKKVNVVGTKNICEAAENVGAHLIYISTDYVFDGKKGDYREKDETRPLSNYAQTKLEGENVVRRSDTKSTVIRTSVVFKENYDNFFTWAKSELEEKGEVGAITDQICCPTYAPNLSEFILESAEEKILGTYHVTGESKVSRYEAVQIMKEELGLSGKVVRTKMKDLPWSADRPENSSLSIAKSKRDFDTTSISISEAFNRMRE
ncbi:MAG: dTDP-4-dehydrorhamnose reductase [Candidatus Nanohaloarchaea archaeon]